MLLPAATFLGLVARGVVVFQHCELALAGVLLTQICTKSLIERHCRLPAPAAIFDFMHSHNFSGANAQVEEDALCASVMAKVSGSLASHTQQTGPFQAACKHRRLHAGQPVTAQKNSSTLESACHR